MNKNELIKAISDKTQLSVTDSEKSLNAILETIETTLADGDDVALVGFGSFTVSERAARTGRNPQTGEAMQIPAAKVARFKAGKKLKEAVNT